jgi:ribosomal-protein-alanine N-acetyltransferase
LPTLHLPQLALITPQLSMIKIREAGADDLKSIQDIDQSLFGSESYPLFVLRQFLDISNGLLKVAEVEEEVIGYSIGHYNTETAEGWMLSLGVLPEYRGKEIGQKLSIHLIREIEEKGAAKIFLTVHPDNNPAIRTYQKLGFVKHQHKEDYYLDNSPRILMLRKPMPSGKGKSFSAQTQAQG